MDPKGKGMVVNDKEKESIFNEPRDDKPTNSGSSHKKNKLWRKKHHWPLQLKSERRSKEITPSIKFWVT